MKILLPQIKKVSLYGFHPLFNDVVEIEINNNLFLILGGNGLGKTTILQAIIFGIGGPADTNIETKENKERRWNKYYFRERLDNPDNASIESTFYLGTDKIYLVRGFKSDNILAFHLNDKIISSDKKETERLFEKYLQDNAGYSSLLDFYFVVHKLCYLSEKRENLAWDLDAQTRILMQIFSDSGIENQFRIRRAELKEIDSKIRHKTVDINWLGERIYELKNINSNEILSPKTIVKKNIKESGINLDELQADLININDDILTKQKELNESKKSHLSIATEIEALQEVLTQNEQAFIFEQINKIESTEAKLAIHKLIHRKLCPSCGNISESLYERATEYIKEKSCPLCGTKDIIESNNNNPEAETELYKKLQTKINIEKKVLQLNKELESLNETFNNVNVQANKYLLHKSPSVIFINRTETTNVDEKEIEQHELALIDLKKDRIELEIQFKKLQSRLDKEYESFNILNDTRIKLLSKLYEKYATEFLGIRCTLESIENSDRFLNLKLLVPNFNKKARNTPDSCSEAQRFFLDIAFRMALIQLASELSNFKGTFICETPENALDITYINSVSDMLQIFSLKDKNILLMSNNIQSEGLAKNLLIRIKNKKKRKESFLNLIEIGNLSKVQSSEKGLFKKEINKILRA
jgi:chromosome segregation ATPase